MVCKIFSLVRFYLSYFLLLQKAFPLLGVVKLPSYSVGSIRYIKNIRTSISYPLGLSLSNHSVLKFVSNYICIQKRFFFSNELKSTERIGPHNIDVISIIVGSLLSNSYIEKRDKGFGFRIIFINSSNNVEYLMKFHSFLAKNGYCSEAKPKLSKLVGKENKVLFIYVFKSYSFSSFD